MSPSINVIVPGFCLPYTGYTVSIAASRCLIWAGT